jgi:uncharacterized membrane protein
LDPLHVSELSPDGAPASVAEKVETVIRVENEALRPRSRSEAITDAIGGFVGTISLIVLQIVAFAGWVVVNAGIILQIPPFDPFPYSLASSITSLEAVLIAAFVLMKQNRMGIIADRRYHLDLQVNLLTERQPTQIIQMLDRLSTHLGVEHHHDDHSRRLGRHVAVEHLVEEVHSRLPDSETIKRRNVSRGHESSILSVCGVRGLSECSFAFLG